ncbi:MAG: outer membrane beta-barrel protein [bacterium]
MPKNRLVLTVLSCCFFVAAGSAVFGGDLRFGIGINAGISRLEGDSKSPQISPMVSGHLRILPIPYFAISGDLGFSQLNTNDRRFFSDFKTTIVPFELSGIVNFLPFNKVNPYVMIGGGGVYWKATNSGTTLQDNLDSFLKTGGGIEYRLNPSFSLDVGATFRFSFTDAFDQLRQGDENDQVLDTHVGLTYYFKKGGGDKDHDSIPDELDLLPEIAEDHDGYLDHDGIPEKNPFPLILDDSASSSDFDNNISSPIVIHQLIHQVESGHRIPVRANVYSNVDLRVVAVIYRHVGNREWNVIRMTDLGDHLYEGFVPGREVTGNGFEYCVVAVDETLRGIGYSGLPSMPIEVHVNPNGKFWRILGGFVGASTIGTASYLVARKQN